MHCFHNFSLSFSRKKRNQVSKNSRILHREYIYLWSININSGLCIREGPLWCGRQTPYILVCLLITEALPLQRGFKQKIIDTMDKNEQQSMVKSTDCRHKNRFHRFQHALYLYAFIWLFGSTISLQESSLKSQMTFNKCSSVAILLHLSP